MMLLIPTWSLRSGGAYRGSVCNKGHAEGTEGMRRRTSGSGATVRLRELHTEGGGVDASFRHETIGMVEPARSVLSPLRLRRGGMTSSLNSERCAEDMVHQVEGSCSHLTTLVH
jgi:hypothetical protein